MTSRYATDSRFLYINYGWPEHQHQFPNAKLLQVKDPPAAGSADAIELPNCERCEAAYHGWLAE